MRPQPGQSFSSRPLGSAVLPATEDSFETLFPNQWSATATNLPRMFAGFRGLDG
jgi:hypothetical protein